jgi:hypothetical protein
LGIGGRVEATGFEVLLGVVLVFPVRAVLENDLPDEIGVVVVDIGIALQNTVVGLLIHDGVYPAAGLM